MGSSTVVEHDFSFGSGKELLMLPCLEATSSQGNSGGDVKGFPCLASEGV